MTGEITWELPLATVRARYEVDLDARLATFSCPACEHRWALGTLQAWSDIMWTVWDHVGACQLAR